MNKNVSYVLSAIEVAEFATIFISYSFQDETEENKHPKPICSTETCRVE